MAKQYKYKREYISIYARSSDSLESSDRAQRNQDTKAWAAVSENLPPNAFGDEDPEAVKEDHIKYYPKPTDIGAARSVLDDAGYPKDK